MANPYYIKTRSTLDRLKPLAELGLQFHGMKQQAEIAKGVKDVATERNRLEGRRVGVLEQEGAARFGTQELPGPVQPGQGPLQTRSLAERSQQLKEMKFEAEQEQLARAIKITDQPMDPAAIPNFKASLKGRSAEMGVDLSASAEPLFNQIETLNKQGAKRYEVFKAVRVPGGLYDQQKPAMLAAIDKELQKAHDSKNADEIERLTATRNNIDSGEILLPAFPHSYARFDAEQKELAAEATGEFASSSLGIFSKKTGKIKAPAPLKAPPKLTQGEKKVSQTLADDAYSYTHDEEGNTITPSDLDIQALRETAKNNGKGLAVIKIPADPGSTTFGVKHGGKPKMTLLIPHNPGEAPTSKMMLSILVNDHGLSEEEAIGRLRAHKKANPDLWQ